MNGPIDDSLARLSRHLVGDSTLADTLAMVCHASVVGVPPTAYSGISMTIDGKLGTYVFSDPAVIEIDYSQYETGDGPCVQAFRSGEMVLVESTTAPGPYPEFRAIAHAHGINSVLALPLIAEAATIGALNLFARGERAFDRDAIDSGRQFAEQAAFVLANSKAYWEARNLSENLTVAMASRAEIEQAKGIIMSTMHVSADEAFETLRQQSQHENMKLREVALEIVQRSSRKTTARGPKSADRLPPPP
jgi:GAF domain-containing protein